MFKSLHAMGRECEFRLYNRQADISVCTHQMLKGPSLSEEEQAFLEDNLPATYADIPLGDFLPLPQTKSYHAVNEVETMRLQSADFREVSVSCACISGHPTCL